MAKPPPMPPVERPFAKPRGDEAPAWELAAQLAEAIGHASVELYADGEWSAAAGQRAADKLKADIKGAINSIRSGSTLAMRVSLIHLKACKPPARSGTNDPLSPTVEGRS